MLDQRALGELVSANAGFELRRQIEAGGTVPVGTNRYQIKASDDVDMLIKGHMDRTLPEKSRRLKDNQIAWVDRLVADGRLDTYFNTGFSPWRIRET